MAQRKYNVVVTRDASFDDVKRKLESLGMVIAGEHRVLRYLTGSIAQEREGDVRAIEGVKVAPDGDVTLAGK